MKRLVSFLYAVILMTVIPFDALAANVYLRSGDQWNDNVDGYKFTQVGNTNEYTYTFTPTGTMWFRIAVEGWNDRMQPTTNNALITVGGSKYTIASYGDTNAWQINASNYSSITIHVDISEGSSRQVWATGIPKIELHGNCVASTGVFDSSWNWNELFTRGDDGHYHITQKVDTEKKILLILN